MIRGLPIIPQSSTEIFRGLVNLVLVSDFTSNDRFELTFPNPDNLEAFKFRENSKAFMVDPRTGDMFIITKRDYAKKQRLPKLFLAPFYANDDPTDETGELILQHELDSVLDSVTGADISPDGSEILVVCAFLLLYISLNVELKRAWGKRCCASQ